MCIARASKTPGTVSPDFAHGRITSPYVDIPATQPPMHVSIDVPTSPSRSLSLKEQRGSPSKSYGKINTRDVHKQPSPRREELRQNGAEDAAKTCGELHKCCAITDGALGKGSDILANHQSAIETDKADGHVSQGHALSHGGLLLGPEAGLNSGLVPERLFAAPPSIPTTPDLSDDDQGTARAQHGVTWCGCLCGDGC